MSGPVSDMCTRLRRTVCEQLSTLPILLRHALIGAALVALPAGVVGVAVGLHTHAPTVWAAGPEFGVPGALVGGLLGLLVGAFVALSRRVGDD